MKCNKEKRQKAILQPITAIAEAAGVQLICKGQFISASEADTSCAAVFMYDEEKQDTKSVQFFDDDTGGRYIRYSTGEKGNNIDFLINFCGMSYSDAVNFIVDGTGTARIKGNIMRRFNQQAAPKEFILPRRIEPPTEMYRYLMEERCLSKDIIDFWYKRGLIYQSVYDTIPTVVFRGYDEKGKCVFANHRGTQLLDGKKLQRDVAANNKNYGITIVNDYSNIVDVFEAAIDCMSYMDLAGDIKKKDYHNKVVLGGVTEHPLETFLDAHPGIDTIRFCLDFDKPGKKAAENLASIFSAKGYVTEIFTSNNIIVPTNANEELSERLENAKSTKDWNEFIVCWRS